MPPKRLRLTYDSAGMKTVVNTLATICAVAAALGAVWALFISLEIVNRTSLAMDAGDYQRETMTVARLVRESSSRPRGPSTSSCYAEGTVGSSVEQLTLTECEVNDKLEVVKAEVAPGAQVDVLINRKIGSGPSRYYRVVRYRPDFEAAAWEKVRAIAPLTYGPMLVPAVAALLLWAVGRFGFGAGAGFWTVWTVGIVLALQAVGLAVVRYFSTA